MIKYLIDQAKEKNISFHMPGHKGSGIYIKYGYEDFLKNIADCDITEIPGADNLHQPEGIIKEIEESYAKLYGVKKSFLLVNGTTAGILASILATVKPGKKLLMSRGCHKSVYSGVQLGNITPVYVQPQINHDSGIIGEVSVKDIEAALEKDDDIQAVILPSPNYYGICSDIKAIGEAVHKKGKILIVDQAHGAHLKFFHKYGCGDGMPKAAEDCGADIVINSTHKTLASFTQSAILNVASDRVDIHGLFEKLKLVQSTSPSYLLMASLAINAEVIENHGREIFEDWRSHIDKFYREAKRIDGLTLIDDKNLDRTKLNINLGTLGISGRGLEKYLLKKGIVAELVTGDILMAMSGMGNQKSDYEKLLTAIENAIAEMSIANRRYTCNSNDLVLPKQGEMLPHGDIKEEIKLEAAAGKISGGTITPYPPGIPYVCPGEKISEEVVKCLLKLREDGRQISGLSEDGLIHIYKE